MHFIDEGFKISILIAFVLQHLSPIIRSGVKHFQWKNNLVQRTNLDILSWNKFELDNSPKTSIKETISIHVFGWRRSKSIRRLCESLLKATYHGHQVPLYFHIDGDGLPKVTEYAQNFQWPHGPKVVNVSPTHLGMPKSILSGWIPKSDDEYAIMLEDDVEVSEAFFEYILYCISITNHKVMLEGDDHGMMGCSMYTPKVNEIGPAPNAWSPPSWNPGKLLGYKRKVFYFQLPCSWGAIYNGRYWRQFLQYYSIRSKISNFPETPNSRSNEWFSSWKRILIELMLFKGWYLLYPNFPNRASLSTNYFEKGIHSVAEGKTPHIPDEIRKFGDRRFTVPLLRDFSILRAGLPILSAGILTEIPFVNLYHDQVDKRKDLIIDAEPFLEAVKNPELSHFFNN